MLLRLAFYRPDYVLVRDPDGQPTSNRADFVRGSDSTVGWLRVGGRLIQHAVAETVRVSGAASPAAKAPTPATLLRRL